MASISEIQSGSDGPLEPPQAQEAAGVTTGSVTSDVPGRSGVVFPEPQSPPKIHDPNWQREGMPDTEFNRKYPPDPWGEEAAPNARVWKIYRDQQEVLHDGMLAGWNTTLDVLLIFAGLFSAVVTAFVIESYKSLQPDYTQYVATFLYAAVVSHNGTGVVFPTLDQISAPDRFIQTSAAQRWTNGFWFSSLVTSLAVALLCILVKQWLNEYDSHVASAAPSPRHWARRHCMYHRGLERWRLPGLISFLPLLLHLSLFLFFAGLVLFLLPLDDAISHSLLVMVSCIGTFYVLCLVLPAWRIECPSYTPLLAQALLAVAGGISALLYVTDSLRRHVQGARRWLRGHDVHYIWEPLDDCAVFLWRARQYLASMKLCAKQQLARETPIISKLNEELDGYVLSSLLHLPADTNMDAIATVIAAIGVVASTRTIEIVTRNLDDNVFFNKILACYENIPPTETGFATISRAQLYRGSATITLHSCNVRTTLPAAKSLSSLGIDGLLLQALSTHTRQQFNNILIGRLQSLHLRGDSSPVFPRRSTCLIFLEHDVRYYHDLYPSFVTAFLLVFCAGDFVSAADTVELVRALRSVEVMLRQECFIALTAHNGGEKDYIRAVLDGLWILLADFTRYNIDALTAKIVAQHALACFDRVFPIHEEGDLSLPSGFTAFVRSPTFRECVDTDEGFDAIIMQVCRRDMLNNWACIVHLLKLSWDCVPWPTEALCLLTANTLFPVEASHLTRWFSRGIPYATQDDLYEPALSAILTSQSAIPTWTIGSHHEISCIAALIGLAYRISIVLCRRKRLGRASDAFIHGFFSGSFLLACFRELASRDEEWRSSSKDILFNLSKHCIKLSPAACLEICTQLEETGDADSELRARARALAQSIRDGSTPGAALSAECSADCPCMLPAVRAAPSIRMCWDALKARFRATPAASVTSHNV